VESAAGYTAAAAVACVTLSLYVSGITPSGFRDWASLAAGLVTFAAGGFVVVKNWRMGVPHALNCLVSMQVAYLANSLLCLVAFLGEWQVGAYLTLLTALVYVAEITIASRTSPRSSHAGG
jgi:phosphatidylserine synthase